MDFDTSLPNSTSRAGLIILWASASNYAIPVAASSSSENDKPAAIMYFLDWGGGSMAQLTLRNKLCGSLQQIQRSILM